MVETYLNRLFKDLKQSCVGKKYDEFLCILEAIDFTTRGHTSEGMRKRRLFAKRSKSL